MKRVRQRKNILAVVTALTLLLTGCQYNNTKGTLSSAKYAVLYTTDSGDRSQIEWLDQAFQVTATSKYPFSGASLDGFANASMQDGKLVLVPRGDGQKKDYDKIVLVNTNSGQAETIDIGRTNSTGFSVEGHQAAVVSNLNWQFYIDLVDLDTGNIQSMTVADENLYVTDVILAGGQIYAGALRGDQEGSCLCRMDMDAGACEILLELPDEINFLEWDGAHLLFFSQGELVKYKIATGEHASYPLTRTDPFNLQMTDGVMWIAYTDIHNEQCDSLIEARSTVTDEVLYSAAHHGAILQVEYDGEYVYVAGYDQLHQYRTDRSALRLTEHIPLEKHGFYFGGFYLTV